jgi:hypothetical protein
MAKALKKQIPIVNRVSYPHLPRVRSVQSGGDVTEPGGEVSEDLDT